MLYRIRKDKNGSISLETAIILPMVIILFVLFVCLIRGAMIQFCVNDSLYKTADFMARYAFIYSEEGIENIEGKVLEKLDELLNKYIASDSIRKKIYEKVDFNKLINNADDYLYRQIAYVVFMTYLENNTLYKKGLIDIDNISFDESEFFNGQEDILLKIRARCDVIDIKSSVRVGAWTQDKFNSVIVSNMNIWELDNLIRGQIIRQIFGATLPLNHPVIAAYTNGTAISIKSLDHTAQTYADKHKFEMTIRNMIENLSEYKGTDDMNISTRILILVMPENKMTVAQNSVMPSLLSFAASKNVKLDIQLYQESKK